MHLIFTDFSRQWHQAGPVCQQFHQQLHFLGLIIPFFQFSPDRENHLAGSQAQPRDFLLFHHRWSLEYGEGDLLR